MGSNYCRSLVLVKGNKAVDQTVSLPHKYIFSAKLSVFTAFFLSFGGPLCVQTPPSIPKCLCTVHRKFIITTQVGEHRQMAKKKMKQNKQMRNQREIALFQSKLLRANRFAMALPCVCILCLLSIYCRSIEQYTIVLMACMV